jgi:hypothetical protein
MTPGTNLARIRYRASMAPRNVGVTLDLRLEVLATAAGGRSRPIVTGSRPLCILDGPAGQTVIGLCELRLERPIAPGESGIGRLSFAIDVSDEIWARLPVGSRFTLAEGPWPIAAAEVRGRSR